MACWKNATRISPLQRNHNPTVLMISPTCIMISPMVLMITPTVLNTPTVLMISPHASSYPPHVSWYPPRYWTPSTVLMISPHASWYPPRYSWYPPRYSWYPPTVLNISHSTQDIPHGTHDIPHIYHDIPHGAVHPWRYSRYPPHGTQDISPHRTHDPPQYCTHIIQGVNLMNRPNKISDGDKSGSFSFANSHIVTYVSEKRDAPSTDCLTVQRDPQAILDWISLGESTVTATFRP